MADLTTLQEHSDLIASLQRQINDLDTIITGHTETLGHQGDDIDDLQNPPAGVPPALLDWFSTPHSIREVDTQLDTDLDTL